MGRQMFLFGDSKLDVVNDNVASSEVRILAWNIQNPSIDRARKQLDWLIQTRANVLVLTEATYSEGSLHLINQLESLGFKIFFSEPLEDKYATAICTKGFQCEEWDLKLSFLPSRLKAVILQTFLGSLRLVGMYSPTFWSVEPESATKKRRAFHNQIMRIFNNLCKMGYMSNLIVGGDLNALESNHVPRIAAFKDYDFYESFIEVGLVDAYRLLHPNAREHSWFSHDRVGYRFDHFFVSKDLSSMMKECYYDHEQRFSRLSDHSAMWLKFKA